MLIFGFLPYRFTISRAYRSQENCVLVTHQECTCCGDFKIEQGVLDIPDSLGGDRVRYREIQITGPFAPFHSYRGEADLDLLRNTFLLRGQVVAIDSEAYCEPMPVFQVSSWRLKTYYPRCLTFGDPGLLIYLFAGLAALVFSGLELALWVRRMRN